ncbi:50S ribosomal protein L29 [bacterium]|nr:50S ribosomal protein L29 [bacterium]
MKFKEIQKESLNNLHSLLADNREKLRDLRFKDSNKQLKNVKEISEVKKTIAKILTAINKIEQEKNNK